MLIQPEMATREAGFPAEGCIRLHVGINVSEVIVKGLEFYGDGLNLASRLYHHFWMMASHWHLGHTDNARTHARQVLELKPGLTIARFRQREPYRDEADLERRIVAMRGVGLPD